MGEKIILNGDDGEAIELYILEGTRLGGADYILASDVETGDGECYILKDMSAQDDDTAVYEIVQDDHENDYLLSVFAELLEDVDLEF